MRGARPVRLRSRRAPIYNYGMQPAGSSDGAPLLVAGFWRRAAASVVDAMLLVPLVLVFAGATSAIAGGNFPRWGEIGFGYMVHLALDGGPAGWAALVTGAVIVVLYMLIFVSAGGQTPGKRVLGLKVIDLYGETPSVPRALLRVVGQVLSMAVFSLGWLWIGFSREKRGLHDLIAGTYVVLTRRMPVRASVPQTTVPAAAGAP